MPTTAKNVFKPPPAEGTTSAERAKRYLGDEAVDFGGGGGGGFPSPGEGQGPKKSSSLPPGGGSSQRRPSVGGSASPTKSRGSGSNVGGGKSPKRRGGGSKEPPSAAGGGLPSRPQQGAMANGMYAPMARDDPAAMMECAEDEIDHEFAATWNFFERPEPVPNGSLGKIGHGGPSPGMSHPPQNPKIQKELMRYFQKHQVEAAREHRPIRQLRPRPRPTTEETMATSTSSMSPMSRQTSAATDMARSSRMQSSMSLASVGEDTMGSQPSSPSGAKAGELNRTFSGSWSLPWAPDMPVLGNERGAGGTSASRRGAVEPKEGKVSAAELWQQFREMHSKHVETPPPVSFLEMSRWGRDLVSKSRDHGFDLSKKSTEEVSELAMYHNRLSRSTSSLVSKSKQKTPDASQTLRDLSVQAASLNEDELSAGDSVWSLRSSPSRRSARSLRPAYTDSLDAVRSHSPKKLFGKAEALKTAGPNRLQFLSEVAQVSTASGAAAHRDRTDWLYASVL